MQTENNEPVPEQKSDNTLGWSIPANLRWLAEQRERPRYMPCGMLTGAFLLTVAERFEKYAPFYFENHKDQEDKT